MNADAVQVFGVIFLLLVLACSIAVAGYGIWCIILACIDAPRGIRGMTMLVGVVILTVGVLFAVVTATGLTNLHRF